VTALAFDSHGTLWMATAGGILGASAAQLSASSNGAITPRYTIPASSSATTPNALQTPSGLAFDANGNLWVANSISVVEYTAAQLASATTGSASPAPTHYVTDSNATGETYDFVAFDAHGNLWVSASVAYQALLPGDTTYATQYADSVLEFSASQLGNLASDPTPTPVVSLGESIAQDNAGIQFGALAFDGGGNLWLGLSGASGGGAVVRYPAANLAGNGQPDITLTSPNGTGYGNSLAFNPTPTGLPINGAHVAVPLTRARLRSPATPSI
jgi:sugar lactone lactonase YvrE